MPPPPATKVLVTDDDRAVRSALNVNLSKAGYAVTLSDNAEEALERLHNEPFDVLLTDVKMPGESRRSFSHQRERRSKR